MVKTVRLLIIDDSSSDVFLIREILIYSLETHFEIESLPTLSSGLECLTKASFDAVLLDLSLPDSRGVDTFKKIHEAHPELPVIVMSGVDDQDLVQTVMERGAQDYLVKGEINRNLLKRAILNAILRKSREREMGLLQDAVDCAGAGILISDLKGKIVFCNRAAARMHGSSPSDLKGKPIETFSTDLLECLSNKCIQKNGTIIRNDGSRLRVNFTVDAILTSSGPQKFVITIFELG